MALSFPTNPQLNDTYTSGSTAWQWNGEAWIVLAPTEVSYETVNTTDLVATGDTTLENLTVTGTVTGIDAGGGALALNDLTDVSVSSPGDQDVLFYSQTSQSWISAPIPAGEGDGSFNGGTISNALFINNITGATNYNSGALRVGGGASISENLYVAGQLVVEDENIQLRARSTLRLYTSDNSNYVAIQGPDSSSDITYVLPGTDGTAGQFLRTNGSGVLSWATAEGGGGGGVTNPGGISGQIQFNDSGLFAGDAGLTYDPSNTTLSTVNIIASGTIASSDTTESLAFNSGALTIAGGAGIGGNVNVAGSQNTFTGNTTSTSINTGTIVVTGGMGISGKVHVGDTVSTSAVPTDTDHLTNKKYVDANVLAFSVAFGA